MTDSSCNMARLVEALHDGRLAEREATSVERHLAQCKACRARKADLASLRELARAPCPAPLPIDHQRGRVALLQRAASQELPAARKARKTLVATLSAAAAIILAILSLWPAPQAFLAASAGLEEKVLLPRRTVVTASEGAVFSRATSGERQEVILTSGTVHLSVRHLVLGERFLVRTSDAEVEVRGTVFSVEAEEGLIQRVAVEEGKVVVRYRGAETFVLPGDEWLAPKKPLDAEPKGEAEASLIASTRVPLAAQRVAATRATPGASAPEDTSAKGASETFREAMSAVEKGDFGAANERLERFGAEHPDDPRAEDAAFLRVLALSRAGRKDEAAKAAESYLQRFPKGFRRAEAEAIARGSANSP